MAVQSLSPALRVSAWPDRDHSLRCSSGLTTTVSNHAIAGGTDILPPINFCAYCHSSNMFLVVYGFVSIKRDTKRKTLFLVQQVGSTATK